DSRSRRRVLPPPARGGALHARRDAPRRDAARAGGSRRLLGESVPRACEGEASGSRDEPLNPTQLRLASAEGVDDTRIELPPGLREDLVAGLLPRTGRAVRAVARDRVERVGDREDAGGERDVLPLEAVGIPRADPALVMMAHDREPLAREGGYVAQHLEAQHRVLFHHASLLVRQRSRLLQDAVGDADLADVVEHEAVFDADVLREGGLDGAGEVERVSLDA